MKTTTQEYVRKQTTAHECKPIPCDIPPFCRNNYFTGKLLTERDLTAEQRYLMDKLRLHHLALHGWGVVCGLKIKPHPYCPHLRVIVEPGLAIDPCGRFIRVLEETEVELPQPTRREQPEEPCPPDMPPRYGPTPTGKGPSSGWGYAATPQTGGEGHNYSAGEGYNERSSQYGRAEAQDYSRQGGAGQTYTGPPEYGTQGQKYSTGGWQGYSEGQQYGGTQRQEYPTSGRQRYSEGQQYGGTQRQDYPAGGWQGYPEGQQYGGTQGQGYTRPSGSSEATGYQQTPDYQSAEGYTPRSDYERTPGYESTPQYSGKGTSYQPYPVGYGEHPGPAEPYQPTVNLYFCLAYAECDDEMMPAPFDECACTGNDQKPNRICETFKITVTTEPPRGIDEVGKRRDMCLVDDCHELYDTVLNQCSEPSTLECLPLAIVEGHRLGEAVTKDVIDNESVRPLLPSTRLLDQLIYCVLDKVSTKSLTKITDLNWDHRGEYEGHGFMRQFIGDPQSVRGFEITFSAPVRPEGITRRTFQAIAVRYTDRYSGGQIEVAPAEVRISNDRRKAFLQIDRGYAERRLMGTRFDLFLKLRCNHVVDDTGLAIDGDLLARIDSDGNYVVAPTGDGVAGGLFESWIRVYTGPREGQRTTAV